MYQIDSPSAGTTIRLTDGRTLGYTEYGNPAGPVLFYCHGHPGSRLEAQLLAEPATKHGLRLIGIDRPGMGLSQYQRRRRVRDWPHDVVQLADRLGIDSFAVAGFSGGALTHWPAPTGSANALRRAASFPGSGPPAASCRFWHCGYLGC